MSSSQGRGINRARTSLKAGGKQSQADFLLGLFFGSGSGGDVPPKRRLTFQRITRRCNPDDSILNEMKTTGNVVSHILEELDPSARNSPSLFGS
jgi:hypothetical protein